MAPTGLHGHLADPVELASPDHQVYKHSFEGECCLQPSKSCSRPHGNTALHICTGTQIKASCCHLQFFKEANETYSKLQKEHETIRSKFTCDKNTPLENLIELLKNLEVFFKLLLSLGHKIFLIVLLSDTAAICMSSELVRLV